MFRMIIGLVFVAALSGCETADRAIPAEGPANAVAALNLGGIETGPDGRCFARMDAPTQTTIIDQLELVVPETRDASGNVTAPPVYRTVSRPQTVTVGEGRRFETLCPPQFTPERVATVQRALRVRGTYAGPINGTLDTVTGAAIRQFQAPSSIQSNLLEIGIARQLGIVTTPVAELNRR